MEVATIAWSILVAMVLGWLWTTTVCIWRRRKMRKERAVGFFHPFTTDGGGGERVLWCAVKALQELFPDLTCAVYTGDPTTPQALAQRASSLFGVHLPQPLKVVKLEKRRWIEARSYPHLTLFGQCFGSIILAWEALTKFTPLVFLDTTGYAFTYPVARACGCKVVCYTHYPTISSDMLSRVINRTSMYNNNSTITRSFLLTTAKSLYYMLMTMLYGLAGRCSDLVMVNSSWTESHIQKLWKIPHRTVRIYPPCDTTALQALPLERTSTNSYIISVAQFRPEKAHSLQLEAFAAALHRLEYQENGELDKTEKSNSISSPKLKFVGSCRNSEDRERLNKLKSQCQELGIQDQVEFHENISYVELKDLLGGAIAGLHAMVDEHFGISVVEYMAAGAIPIAHNSAGPKEDIVLDEDGEKTGFLAVTKDEFADAMFRVFTMSQEEHWKMAKAARQRASRFSVEKFDRCFKAAIEVIIPLYSNH